MKAYNIIKNSLLVLSVLFLAISGVAGGAIYNADSGVIATVVTGQIGLALVGLFLSYTQNDISKKIGYALLTASFVVCLIAFMYAKSSTASSLMLVSVIIYALYYVVTFIGFLASRGKGTVDDPDNDPRIIKLKKWQSLKEEGLITAEEFEEKRQEILGIKKSAK